MAVYTDVSFEDLERLLEQYDIGEPLSFKGIAEGVENSNFYLQTDRGAFILTLYEKRVAAEDLPFFLGLMEHLARRGIHCPLPVQDPRRASRWSALNRPQRRHRHLPDRHFAAPPGRRALRRRRRRAGRGCTRRGEGFALARAQRAWDRRLAAAGGSHPRRATRSRTG